MAALACDRTGCETAGKTEDPSTTTAKVGCGSILVPSYQWHYIESPIHCTTCLCIRGKVFAKDEVFGDEPFVARKIVDAKVDRH